MLVTIRPQVYGPGFTMEPKSSRNLAAICKKQLKNGMTSGAGEPVYFQSWEDMEFSLSGNVSARAMGKLWRGYAVTCRMDSWTVRHMFGYCSD